MAIINFIFLAFCPGLFAMTQTECTDDVCKDYQLALDTAIIPQYNRIYRSLTAITHSSPTLTFDDKGRVLLVSATTFDYFPEVAGTEFQLSRQSWFTPFPDLKKACSNYDTDDKSARLNQQLGLPPTYNIKMIGEVYVELKDIFRPCPDPEIFDRECQVSVEVLNNKTSDPNVPWFCPVDGEDIIQVSGAFSQVSRSHFEWMCNNWRGSYQSSDVYKNYPWTGLGYTFDWGSKDGVGLSEFVVVKGATVEFKQKKTLQDYCQSN